MLYVLLKHTIESNNNLPKQYLKIENTKANSVSVGVNTEEKLFKVASTQTKHGVDPEYDLSVNNVETNYVNKSSVTPSSYDVKSKISESSIFDNLNSLLKSPSHSLSSSSDGPELIDKCLSTKFSNLPKKPPSLNNDISSINALLRDLQDSPEYEQSQPSSRLDERLMSIGVTIENHNSTDNFSESHTSNNLSPNTVRPNKIKEVLTDKLKTERVAKAYELRKSMNELPLEQQTKLNQRFNDLFGNNHTYESDPLSEEEERIIAHKRIVKMVVEFMTPYYKAQRINRHLFKSLAKLISKNLMDRAYDPGSFFLVMCLVFFVCLLSFNRSIYSFNL